MFVYLLLVIFLLFLHFYEVNFNNKHAKKNAVISAVGATVILQTFRSFEIGKDLTTYINIYDTFGSFSFLEVIQAGNNEVLFRLLNFFVYKTGASFRLIMFLVSLMLYGSMGIVAYKYSHNAIMSFLIFMTIGLFVFSFSGLRQSISMGFMFLSFIYVKKKKLLPFIFLTIIGTLFHKSALFTLPLYFLYNFKINSLFQPLYLVIIIVVFVFRKDITTFVVKLYDPTGKIVSTGAINMLLLFLLIYIGTYIFYYYFKDENLYRLQRILFVAIIIQIMATYSQTISRMGYYYYAFLILLIPELLHNIRDYKLRKLTREALMLIFSLLFLISIQRNSLETYPYKFMINFLNHTFLGGVS